VVGYLLQKVCFFDVALYINSSLLSLWNLKITKGTLMLLSVHLRMLPHAVTIAYPHLGAVEGYVHPTL
jgi:hypothetical protein